MLKRTLPFAIALVLMSTAAHTRQAGSQSAGGANAAKAGEFEFRINCAFCHGLGARGGGRGPDLTRARKRHANSDAELFRVISNGIPGTAMPANGTNGQGVGMTDEEIWQLVAYICSVEVKAPVVPAPESPTLAAYRSAFKTAGEASLEALLSEHEKHLLPGTPDPELRRLREQL